MDESEVFIVEQPGPVGKIYVHNDLEGGGRWFGRQIVETVKGMNLRPGRAFEWCSGFGYIGFSLINEGLCTSLVLGDVNPGALALAQRTVEENNLNNVTLYESFNFNNIPDHEKFDLIVGNPPHYADVSQGKKRELARFHERIWRDPEWEYHRDFFHQAKKHLNPGAPIVLCENWEGSSPETFGAMLYDAELEHQLVEGIHGFYLLIVRDPNNPAQISL